MWGICWSPGVKRVEVVIVIVASQPTSTATIVTTPPVVDICSRSVSRVNKPSQKTLHPVQSVLQSLDVSFGRATLLCRVIEPNAYNKQVQNPFCLCYSLFFYSFFSDGVLLSFPPLSFG